MTSGNGNGTRDNQLNSQSASAISSNQNLTRRSSQNKGGANIQAATIGFTASGSLLTDSGNGLGVFAVNDVIQVTGSGQDGEYKITGAAAGQCTVDGGNKTVVDESAGALIDVRKIG